MKFGKGLEAKVSGPFLFFGKGIAHAKVAKDAEGGLGEFKSEKVRMWESGFEVRSLGSGGISEAA